MTLKKKNKCNRRDTHYWNATHGNIHEKPTARIERAIIYFTVLLIAAITVVQYFYFEYRF